jgi:hypothetical protein
MQIEDRISKDKESKFCKSWPLIQEALKWAIKGVVIIALSVYISVLQRQLNQATQDVTYMQGQFLIMQQTYNQIINNSFGLNLVVGQIQSQTSLLLSESFQNQIKTINATSEFLKTHDLTQLFKVNEQLQLRTDITLAQLDEMSIQISSNIIGSYYNPKWILTNDRNRTNLICVKGFFRDLNKVAIPSLLRFFDDSNTAWSTDANECNLTNWNQIVDDTNMSTFRVIFNISNICVISSPHNILQVYSYEKPHSLLLNYLPPISIFSCPWSN